MCKSVSYVVIFYFFAMVIYAALFDCLAPSGLMSVFTIWVVVVSVRVKIHKLKFCS